MISTKAIRAIINWLQFERNRDSMRCKYHTIWKLFSKFYFKLDIKPDNWEDRILLYVGHLINNNKKASTINSYIAAIKTVLREDKIKIAEDRFLLNSLVRACKIRHETVTIRLPIQKPLLHVLLKQIKDVYIKGRNPQLYLGKMYMAIFISAYYGLLRIGELAKGDHPILARDVHMGLNKNKLMFILRSSKTHCKSDIPQTVKITSTSNKEAQYCPYKILREYLAVGLRYIENEEQFFVFRDRSPLKITTLSKVLKTTLVQCKLDSSQFSFHGFRAGRGVDLLKLGVLVETIKKIGRWKSNTVFAYLNKFN